MSGSSSQQGSAGAVDSMDPAWDDRYERKRGKVWESGRTSEFGLVQF